MKNKIRTWAPREIRMVAEFLVENYPQFPYQTRVRLGALHPSLAIPGLTESDKKMVGVWRRWADAIVFAKDKLILIEVAIKPEPGDISLLELYEFLVPHTPELQDYSNLPIQKMLVYAIEDPLILALAREHGITVVFFRPDWIDDYLPYLFRRERRSPLTFPLPEGKEKK